MAVDTTAIKNDDSTKVADLYHDQDSSGNLIPVSKILIGADDTDGGLVEVSNPFPVQLSDGTAVYDTSNPVPIQLSDGTSLIDPFKSEGSSLGVGILLQGDDGTNRQNVAVDATTGNLQADVASALPAGDNNIGNVDIISLPNEGQQTMANSVSVAIASDQTKLTVTDDGSFTLAANDGVDIGDVDVASQPARDRTTDNQGAALQTDALMNDTTALTPKFAAIGASSSGDNTIVGGVTGKKIRIISLFLIAGGDVDVFFKDGTTGNDILGKSTNALDLTANSGFSLPANPFGWGETASGEALVMNLSTAVRNAGSVTYVEV